MTCTRRRFQYSARDLARHDYHHISDKRLSDIAVAGMVDVRCRGPKTTEIKLFIGSFVSSLVARAAYVRYATGDETFKSVH